jgi:hypothetical protein
MHVTFGLVKYVRSTHVKKLGVGEIMVRDGFKWRTFMDTNDT